MSTLIERVASLAIGTVESVSPSEIKVILEIDAPQATALNTGVPTRFPRINSYVIIPNESGALVGLVTWLGVERSSFPKRTGLKDFGLVDLPFPLRKMSVSPLGSLQLDYDTCSCSEVLRLERGVSTFPSVGDAVHLPTETQLKSIIEAQGPDRRVQIGTSPLSAGAKVFIDPNKLFGRHVAVLGNTGSGKSCTVAGLIRWSLEQAERVIEESENTESDKNVNARFIVLDPNGEYSNTFSDIGEGVRIFRVPPVEDPINPLCLPAWMWNSNEWIAFAGAAPGAQQPLLLRALREMRSGAGTTEPSERQLSRLFNSRKTQVRDLIHRGPSAYTEFPGNLNCGRLLRNIETEANEYANGSDNISERLSELAETACEIANSKSFPLAGGREGFNGFNQPELERVAENLEAVVEELPYLPESTFRSEDAPIRFEVQKLPDHLDTIAEGQATQFVQWLNMRIRTIVTDGKLKRIVAPDEEPTLVEWLTDYIGDSEAKNGQIAIIDLSLVPTDVLHVVIAAAARIVFEAAQRYRRVNEKELPIVLVLEEAHTFIRRPDYNDADTTSAAVMCRRTFERIAREGRKFGVGLVLSSQRPSELSATVLAQCNTFILHRIVNDRDQQLVNRLVPDNLAGLLSELPSLPTRRAILLGWVVPVPVLVEINELPGNHCPTSQDPSFWEVWTGTEDRQIDWDKIIEDWISL
jgi:DNA helicase HerA-like ATPase